MGVIATVKSQFADYPRVHRAHSNLAVHIFAIPLYWAGLAGLGFGIARLSWMEAAIGVAAIFVSIALQAWGHGRERERALPFTGVSNFFLRLTTELLIVFPNYFIGGGWARAWRGKAQ